MADSIVYAKSKYIKGSPRKARLVMDMIRGKKADQAVDLLNFTQKKAAHDIRKTLESAIANCINNAGWEKGDLVIAEARVDEAPTYRRIRQVSRGRAHLILKRNSHLVIGLKQEHGK